MRTPRLVPVVVAGIAILGSGCAKTSRPAGADTALPSASNTPQNPDTNAVSSHDNYNAKSSAVDTGAERGSKNDSIARSGPPVQRGAVRKP
jgi:hypothetical protein